MNPKARSLKVKPCELCGYPYSDEHHLYPKRDGGIPIIYFCPNHHRLANIIQEMFLDGLAEGEDPCSFAVAQWGNLFKFDMGFWNIIPDLAMEYRLEEARENDRRTNPEYAVPPSKYIAKSIPLGSAMAFSDDYMWRHIEK